MSAKKSLSALMLACLSVGAAHAQGYVQLGYETVSVKENFVSAGQTYNLETSPKVLSLMAGYALHPNVSGEILLGTGLGSNNVSFSSVNSGAEVKVQSLIGAYIKPKFNPTENLELYGRLGYSRTRVIASGSGIDSAASQKGFGWGLGMNYAITNSTYVDWHFTQYSNTDGAVRGTGLALGMRF